jgi:hypothetical protein
MTKRAPAIVFLVLFAAISSACINVTSEAVSRDEHVRTYVRRQRAGKEEPRIAVSDRGTRLVVEVRRQPLCEEDTVAVSQRVDVTTTRPVADSDQNWLTGCWIAGVLGVVGGAVSLAVAPSLSNTSSTDAQGNKTGSDRQTAYILGLTGLVIGVPSLVAAIIDQSRLGTHERRGAPRESLAATQDVPCGVGGPIANAQVTISGSEESAVVGQTNSQGRLEIELRSLPNRVREEILGLGKLEVSTDGRVPARAVWLLPEESAARLRVGEPTRVQQVVQDHVVALTSSGESSSPQLALGPPVIASIRLRKCEVQDGQKGLAMGNGNGLIDRGEMVEITCHLQNIASIVVGDLRLEPVSSNSDVMLTGVQPLKLPSWLPQAVHSLTFGLSVRKGYDLLESLPLPVSVRVSRDTGDVVADVALKLHLGNVGR